MNTNAYQQFYDNPTPHNAIELAIADHIAVAQGSPSYQFVSALRRAQGMIEAAETGADYYRRD